MLSSRHANLAHIPIGAYSPHSRGCGGRISTPQCRCGVFDGGRFGPGGAAGTDPPKSVSWDVSAIQDGAFRWVPSKYDLIANRTVFLIRAIARGLVCALHGVLCGAFGARMQWIFREGDALQCCNFLRKRTTW
jgi:hypothetical protein